MAHQEDQSRLMDEEARQVQEHRARLTAHQSRGEQGNAQILKIRS